MMRRRTFVRSAAAIAACAALPQVASAEDIAGLELVNGSSDRGDDDFSLTFGKHRALRYVFQDDKISRPYFEGLKTLDGTQVTRHHPPRPDVDPTDHDLLHPGLWLAFGDLSGSDNWRLKAKVRHDGFEGSGGLHVVTDAAGNDTLQYVEFTARRVYLTAAGKDLAREVCAYGLRPWRGGWRMTWDSTFMPLDGDLIFGDQEEMGLGVRLATPLIVKNGGTITNSRGDQDEKGCWGKRAAWCDYSGVIGKRRYGILLIPHPKNPRATSFHVRDYGLMVANPFAEQAFGHAKEPARTIVKAGETLRLRYAIFVYAVDADKRLDAAAEVAKLEWKA